MKKVFGMILSAVTLAAVFAVLSLSGCDYLSKSRAADAAWTTTLQGQGGSITGGSVGFAAAQETGIEQLEKGNEAKVAAQVTAQAQADAVRLSYGDILPVATATPCVGGACLMRAETPAVPEERSSGGAWYNGFLP